MLDVSAARTAFTTCACHHGCAPGLDATFTLHVHNGGAMSHAILVTRVTVIPIGTPGGPYVTGTNGYFHVAGAAADGSITLAAGASLDVVVTVYLDIPVVQPGTDRVEITATIDGTEVTYVIAAASVDSAPGC